MKKENIELGNFTLVGMTVRTNNKDEIDPLQSKIGPLANLYREKQIANEFNKRTSPDITYCVYTDYESDEHGEYTYFIGERVDSLDGQDLKRFHSLSINKSNYQKFTTEPGAMPTVVIDAWQKIWQMNENDFGGKRKYIADFEVYDHRAGDPHNTVLDIYIGIE